MTQRISAAARGNFSLQCVGFSLIVVLGLSIAALGLSHPEACGILVPWPGINPVSPALEGRLLVPGPPGKSSVIRS